MLLQGVGVSPGVGIGRAVVIAEGSLDYTQVHFAGVQQEKARLRTAVQAFAQRTQAMADALRARLDGQEADILASQILMANDPALLAQTDSRIEAGECAEAALDAVCASYIQLFAAAGDELLAQRAADIEDIRARLLAILLGRSEASIPDVPPGTVLVAWDLTPSMTVSVNRENVAAFVAECGGMTSHAAILARALGLPAVLGAAGAASVLRSGEDVVVDGGQGAVIVSPSGAELARYRKKQEEEKRQAEALQAYRAGPAVSARGQRYALYANIGGVGQTVAADEAGAEGVGLLRTEFLFMGRTSLPTEEEQYEAYASVSRAMGDRPAVVRTLDIGGDKALPYLGQEKEENPYLGRRGIRYCLARPEVFRTQLRALLRAGAERGNIRLMLPMVTGVQELRAARTMLEQEKQALSARGVAFDGAISLGVMIETPAAAVIADLLAKEADFFSIGTNDLVQYILAADRGNADIAELYAPCHPAVLRSIRDVIAAGRAADVPVCMCGEAAADPCLIPLWMAFGLDSFSAGPFALPEVRRTVSRWTEEEALCTAKEALACPDADAVRALLRALLRAGAERGNIRIMLPMVTGVQELRAARTMLEQEKQALSARGVAFDGAISLGVMIETPAAAVIADLLAKEADFFSIGTNDLVQYILAADRGNADIAELYAPCHPAVLRSIRDVIAAGRAADVPVCMCGEAAADPCLIPLWMAFGLDSFSAGPFALPEVRRTVSRWTEEEALCTAKEALACPDADAVRALLAARRR